MTHLNEKGEARMVDVGGKAASHREALAHATVKMQPNTLTLILSGKMEKGDVLTTARIAGIMAAKRTPELIPLCHPLLLTYISVDIRSQLPDEVEILAKVKCTGNTGVEMEALCAASVAALTIYDMCKAVDRGIEITDVYLVQKSGGKSGRYVRTAKEADND